LKNKFLLRVNAHPSFPCHCIWHHSNRIKLSSNSDLKKEKVWLLGTRYKLNTSGQNYKCLMITKEIFVKDKT
jgi:hypothetical protein